MIDLHPPASGLPLAAALLLCVAEISRFAPRVYPHLKALRSIAVISCLIAVTLAFITGYQASSRAQSLSSAAEQAMAIHHSWGKGLLVSSLLLATFFYLERVATHGKKLFAFLYYLFFIIQVAGTIWVGHLGGELVFGYGVNTPRLQ
jgi:uncharacterized membrane protein